VRFLTVRLPGEGQGIRQVEICPHFAFFLDQELDVLEPLDDFGLPFPAGLDDSAERRVLGQEMLRHLVEALNGIAHRVAGLKVAVARVK
jgi:hypothetical protein